MLALTVAKCDPVPVSAHPARYAAPPPVASVDPASGERSVTFRVLIYNVAGLPWPIGLHRGEALRHIGDALRGLRASDAEPDVVLLQEAFTEEGREIGARAGYAYSADGPGRADAPHNPQPQDAFRAGRSFWKGEKLGKMVGSGLVALSDYPIVGTARQAFGRHDCAGFDCLASKGVLLVRIQVPGIPEPVDIVTTHLNSKRSSGVPESRSLQAYRRQFDEIASFLKTHRSPDHPLVLGGDLNVRGEPARYDYAAARLGHPFVHASCGTSVVCDIGRQPDVRRPGIGTEDLQTFDSGGGVRIEPVSMRLLFQQPVDGRPLSDHAAELVVYRLSWHPARLAAAN